MSKSRYNDLFNIVKKAEGILDRQQVDIDSRQVQRMKSTRDNQLYNISFDSKEDQTDYAYTQSDTYSTRYVPGLPGVQAKRVPGTSNVFADPYSGKIFDYNEGFEEGGVVYNPQGAHLQTSYMYAEASSVANDLKKMGLTKEARVIKNLFKI